MGQSGPCLSAGVPRRACLLGGTGPSCPSGLTLRIRFAGLYLLDLGTDHLAPCGCQAVDGHISDYQQVHGELDLAQQTPVSGGPALAGAGSSPSSVCCFMPLLLKPWGLPSPRHSHHRQRWHRDPYAEGLGASCGSICGVCVMLGESWHQSGFQFPHPQSHGAEEPAAGGASRLTFWDSVWPLVGPANSWSPRETWERS